MASRLELQEKLVELLGSKSVYYQPPVFVFQAEEGIRYSKSRIDVKRADNSIYSKNIRYELIVIDRKPDNPVIDKLLELPYCSYDRGYKADNLNHDVLTIYW